MFVNNINPVFADSIFENWEASAATFKSTGENHLSLLGLAASSFSGTFGSILSFIQLLAIAVASIRLLWTAIKLLVAPSPDRAKAKTSLTISFVILGIALIGPRVAVEIIKMFQ